MSRRDKFVPALAAGGLALMVAVLTYGGYTLLRKDEPGRTQHLPISPQAGISLAGQLPVPAYGDLAVDTGEQLIFFGSRLGGTDVAENAGARLVKSSGEWSALPEAPFSSPIGGADGVWTGDELIILGVDCKELQVQDEGDTCSPATLDAAMYSPSKNSWTALQPPPGFEEVFRPGAEVGPNFGYAIGWTGSTAVFNIAERLAAFDPRTMQWSDLPDPGPARVCAPGDGLVAMSIVQGAPVAGSPVSPEGSTENNLSLRDPGGIDVQTLSADGGKWEAGPHLETGLRAPSTLDFVCGTNAVLAVSSLLDGIWEYQTGPRTWTQKPAAPRELATAPEPLNVVLFTTRAWTGADYAMWSPSLPASEGESDESDSQPPSREAYPGIGIVLEPTKSQWVAAQPGPQIGPYSHRLAWSAGHAYFLVDDSEGKVSLAIYSPV